LKNVLIALFVLFNISYAKSLQPLLNIVNGASAECVMHYFYTSAGWTQVEGEIGRNGIDGLYYKEKDGVIRELLVAESKWNKSKLGFSGKNKTVQQMSQEWVIRTMEKLAAKMDSKVYDTMKRLVEHDQYRARLFHMKPVGDSSIQITVYKIKNRGYKAFDTIRDSQLSPIDINAPKTAFETKIVQSYNRCRRENINKYLADLGLSSEQMERLLRDNYLQVGDF